MKRRADRTDTLAEVELHPLLRGDAKANVAVEEPRKKRALQRGLEHGVNPYYDPRVELEQKPKLVLDLTSDNHGTGTDYDHERTLLAEQDQRIMQRQREDQEMQERRDQGLVIDFERGESAWEMERPPRMEWWDDNGDNGGEISAFIEHPLPVNTEWNSKTAVEARVYLTKAERSKMRRNARVVRQRDQRDMVKLGLVVGEKSRTTTQNSVVASIINPSEVEAQIRTEREQRRARHEEDNASRHAASQESRTAKREAKAQRDLANGIWRSVFVVRGGISGKQRYKMDVNGSEMGVRGVCCIEPGLRTTIIVEGGAQAVEKYRGVIMRRIDWPVEEVWQGAVQQLAFIKWTVYEFKEGTLRGFLERHGMGSLYRAI